MVTRVTQSKIPSNHRKPNMKNRNAKDAVSPSVRGLKTIIPSTVGIAERARYERGRKLARDAAIVVDTLKLVHAAQRTGDASLIAATKPLMPMIKKALDKLGRAADSFARETAATSKKDKPEAAPQSAIVEAPALVEGDPDVAAGLISDAAIHHSYFNGDAIDARRERKATLGRLKYAIETGDLATQHEIMYGTNPREDHDPYATMAKVSANSRK